MNYTVKYIESEGELVVGCKTLWPADQEGYYCGKICSVGERNICHLSALQCKPWVLWYMDNDQPYEEVAKHEWNHFHDLILSITGKKREYEEELIEIFNNLPDFMREEAVEYGMNDSLWRSRVWDLLETKIK